MDAGFTRRDLEERIVEVWNKVDEVDSSYLDSMLEKHPHVVPVSALTGEGIDGLMHVVQAVAQKLSGVEKMTVEFPLREMNARMKLLRETADVVYEDTLNCDDSGENMSIDVLIRSDAWSRYRAQLH